MIEPDPAVVTPIGNAVYALFKDRTDAGFRLAKKLEGYRESDAIVIAIPRGGVPVAAAAAERLGLPWNLIAVRKLPIPWNPEAGFGAVTRDGTVVLNEPMVRGLGMTKPQIDAVVRDVMGVLEATAGLLYSVKPEIDVTDKCAIVVDDGLASGYTMLAAVGSLRARGASRVVAASPVASRSAAELVCPAADECIIEIVSPAVPFAVADYYLQWRDLSDEEVIEHIGAVER